MKFFSILILTFVAIFFAGTGYIVGADTNDSPYPLTGIWSEETSNRDDRMKNVTCNGFKLGNTAQVTRWLERQYELDAATAQEYVAVAFEEGCAR